MFRSGFVSPTVRQDRRVACGRERSPSLWQVNGLPASGPELQQVPCHGALFFEIRSFCNLGSAFTESAKYAAIFSPGPSESLPVAWANQFEHLVGLLPIPCPGASSRLRQVPSILIFRDPVKEALFGNARKQEDSLQKNIDSCNTYELLIFAYIWNLYAGPWHCR